MLWYRRNPWAERKKDNHMTKQQPDQAKARRRAERSPCAPIFPPILR